MPLVVVAAEALGELVVEALPSSAVEPGRVVEPGGVAFGVASPGDRNFWAMTCFSEMFEHSLRRLLQLQQKHNTAQFSGGRSSTSENSPI